MKFQTYLSKVQEFKFQGLGLEFCSQARNKQVAGDSSHQALTHGELNPTNHRGLGSRFMDEGFGLRVG